MPDSKDWKPLAGNPAYYVSRDGRIWSAVVGHLNEDPKDPRLVNLAWITRRENAIRAVLPA